MLRLELPYPPTVNTYWRMFNNRMIISKKGREYRNAVNTAIIEQKANKKLEGRLRIHIAASMPDKRRRDLDNINKAALDGLQNAGVYLDDSQIDELIVVRGPIEPPGSLEVLITEI